MRRSLMVAALPSQCAANRAVTVRGPRAALRPGRYALASLVLLMPCFWQARIQAGDLSSHIYNAWLAQLVESGRAPGLVVATQATNILFDAGLSGLFRLFGAEVAQRVAVSLAVLVFVWGAFAFVRAAAGIAPWHLLPALAMLAYGWVYHMGFFNFYVSLGLCFGALALLWEMVPRRMAGAVPLLALAYAAHPLPVFWSLGVLAYVMLARRFPPPRRVLLTAGCLGLMVAGHFILRHLVSMRWSPTQFGNSLGLEQVWVFDVKYVVLPLGLLGVWALLLGRLLRRDGSGSVVSGIPFQVCLLGAAAVVLLPGAVRLPGAAAVLGYIPERMSLPVAVCACALLAGAPARRADRHVLLALALVFFAFLYRDERKINAFEARVQNAVSALPADSRVIMPVADSAIRANPWWHILDRACLGRCYSYGNYEPATLQFRVRAAGRNRVVAATPADVDLLRQGGYLVRQADLPLYQVEVDAAGGISIQPLRAGALCAPAKLAL